MGEEIESLPSIKKQTYQHFEIIIEYDKKKQGASAMRNKGAKKAKGEYLFFCDNDVELVPDCLESLYKHLKAKGADWCHARVQIDEGITPIKGEIPLNKHTEHYFWYFHGISTMALIKKSAKPVWDEKVQRYNDWDLWMDLDSRGKKGVQLNKVILTTKNRPTGISMQNDTQEALDKLRKKWKIDKRKVADIIIPHHNRHDHLKNCLEGIDNKFFNIIVVSGGSFAENCNKGAKIATTDTLIFLNDDVEADTEKLLSLADADFDYCGTSQIIQGVKFYGIGWRESDPVHDGLFLAQSPNDCFVPSGFCFKFTRKAWDKLGGLNEEYRNGGEDTDIGIRAHQLKMKVGYIDEPMVHHHSQSQGRFDYAKANNDLFNSKYKVNSLTKLKCINN